MKKVLFVLLIPMLLFATDLSKKTGFEFFASPTAKIGIKHHANRVYAINPSISFLLAFYYDYDNEYDYMGDEELLGFNFDQQFYLPEVNTLDHYIFLNVSLTNVFDPYIPDFGTGYGMQYQINSNFGVFGELGVHFSPYYESLGLSQSGIGILFYVR